MWGKGCATEAIKLITQFGFEDLHLHRIGAGIYDCAIGSRIALEKNGFHKEAVFKDSVIFKGQYINTYRYALIRNERRQNVWID